MSQTEARVHAKILKIAVMDFNLCPMELIRKELQLSTNQIYAHRNTDLYRETVEEMKVHWKEAMIKTPGTPELRKMINYGLGIAVKKLVHILSGTRTPNRDIISAARLMAQMDGRFLGTEAEEERKHLVDESVASELIQMVNRAKGSDKVQ